MMLSITRVLELKDLIKWHTVFCEAGLNANTMRSAMHNKRELRDEEARAILRVLADRGICLLDNGQADLFAIDLATETSA